MAASGLQTSGVAERYAGALFELARDQGKLDSVEKALDGFQAMLAESQDLRLLIISPVFSSREQASGLDAILSRGGVKGLVRDFLMVLARNRRLFVLPAVIRSYKKRVAEERGEIEAGIISAIPLSAEQERSLTDVLRERLGKTPKLNITVNPSLLGGLIVKVSSQMVDTSLRTKLNSIKIAMKEAG